ncbi:MAG: succinate dehydrogenase cytochrome b subunit [Flavobacteriales bacterium]
MSRSGILKSSLAKKYWMAATGLFLCIFLLGHLAGNLQLFMGGIEGKTAFNEYAQFMTTNPVVKIMSWVTYISILFHAIDGVVLVSQNIKARPKGYAYNKPGASSAWASRKMAVLGTVVLAFIVVHMQHFWYQMHFGAVPMQEMGPDGALEMPIRDLHKVVLDFFNPHINSMALVMVIIYVIAQFAIAFHLSHGFKSAFQSLGLNHPKYNKLIKLKGLLFSILIPLAFAIIPVYLYIYHQH